MRSKKKTKTMFLNYGCHINHKNILIKECSIIKYKKAIIYIRFIYKICSLKNITCTIMSKQNSLT